MTKIIYLIKILKNKFKLLSHLILILFNFKIFKKISMINIKISKD